MSRQAVEEFYEVLCDKATRLGRIGEKPTLLLAILNYMLDYAVFGVSLLELLGPNYSEQIKEYFLSLAEDRLAAPKQSWQRITEKDEKTMTVSVEEYITSYGTDVSNAFKNLTKKDVQFLLAKYTDTAMIGKMELSAALVAICPSYLVDSYLQRVHDCNAFTTLLWSHSFTQEMGKAIKDTIVSKGYARLFIYETKKTGGEGIRLAAHIVRMTDVEQQKLKCLIGVCKTKFHVIGYEIFDSPIQLKKLFHFRTGNEINPRMISGNFGLIKDINDEGEKITILCRLKWNEGGWKGPSAPVFSGKAIMAHEEWNLNIGNSVNGYIYADFEGHPNPKVQPFSLHLWSKSPKGDYVLIARYDRAETVTLKELEWVDEYFDTSGIYTRRAENVLDTYSTLDPSWTQRIQGHSRDEQLDFIKEDIKKRMKPARIIKCPVDSVRVFDPPIKFGNYIRARVEEVKGWRYGQPCYLKVYPVVLNPRDEPERVETKGESLDIDGEPYRRRGRTGTTELHDGEKRTRQRRITTKEIRMRESELVTMFRTWLRDTKNIPPSESPKEENYVDVSFEYKGKKYMVEAKYISGSTTIAIRSAIGQLLDYNLYPDSNSTRRDVWLILINAKPTELDFEWLVDMRERFTESKFPVYLCWQEDEGFKAEDQVL